MRSDRAIPILAIYITDKKSWFNAIATKIIETTGKIKYAFI